MSTSSEGTAQIRRRAIVQGVGTVAVAVPALGLLNACAIGGGEDTPTDVTNGDNAGAKNPFGVADNSEFEVVAFTGGAGDAVHTQVEQPLLKAAFPTLKITHSATQQISTTLQPRFVGGNPPDFIENAGSGQMDVNALISQGQLVDLTRLFDAPSIDDPSKKVRDTLVPNTIEMGSFNGTPYTLPYTASASGIWYNAKLFAQKGWKAPATWSDFLALCAQIKAAGITPFGFGGKNAADYATAVIVASAIKAGGLDLIKRIDNLEDGAWQDPAFKASLTAWAEIGAKYVDRSNEGLMHTEVQLMQLQDKVAFYPAGAFIEGEMKKDTPATFEFAMIPTPSLSSADKLPVAGLRAAPSGAFMVAAKGKNPNAGLEYMRQMLSKAGAAGYTKTTGTLTSVLGGADGVALPPGMKSAADAVTAAGQNAFTWRYQGWYKPMSTTIKELTNGLMFGRTTPDQFVEKIQKTADEVKKDSSITKFKRA